MTTTLLLPAPLCEICGDGAFPDDRDAPLPGFEAHGYVLGDTPVCLDCAAFAVWDGIDEFESFEWWTPELAGQFGEKVAEIAKAECAAAGVS